MDADRANSCVRAVEHGACTAGCAIGLDSMTCGCIVMGHRSHGRLHPCHRVLACPWLPPEVARSRTACRTLSTVRGEHYTSQPWSSATFATSEAIRACSLFQSLLEGAAMQARQMGHYYLGNSFHGHGTPLRIQSSLSHLSRCMLGPPTSGNSPRDRRADADLDLRQTGLD